MIRKQTLLETSARKFMPKLFAGVHDDQLGKVKQYISLYARHDLPQGETAAILQDATSSQGKMIRPRLVIMAGSYGIQTDDVRERLYKLGAVIEMTHLASLIHDDVVDDAPFRRGKPSVQRKYGKNAAVYAGDFLMSRLMYVLMKDNMADAGMKLAKAIEEMCTGEIGQSLSRYDEDVTLERYLQNIYGKTVALFQTCCAIGATESGCTEGTATLLASFGECLGFMFQMRDDLLDFAPDSKLIGKAAHQDFREGIYTLPVILAREQRGGRRALHPYMELSAQGILTDEDIRKMEDLVVDLGGMDAAWSYIHTYQKQAEDILETLPQTDASSSLQKLVRKLGAQ